MATIECLQANGVLRDLAGLIAVEDLSAEGAVAGDGLDGRMPGVADLAGVGGLRVRADGAGGVQRTAAANR
jgi:hypothetical protein